MTNEEKYKTPSELTKAFNDFCMKDFIPCGECPLFSIRQDKCDCSEDLPSCEFTWLKLAVVESKQSE